MCLPSRTVETKEEETNVTTVDEYLRTGGRKEGNGTKRDEMKIRSKTRLTS